MKASLNLVWAVILIKQVVGEYGMANFRNKGQSKGKDYCIFFNSQWARLPQHLNKASRLQVYDLTPSVLCSSSEVPEGGFPNRIPMVMRGNCTFYEKVRLAQLNGAKGLLIISKDRLVRGELFFKDRLVRVLSNGVLEGKTKFVFNHLLQKKRH